MPFSSHHVRVTCHQRNIWRRSNTCHTKMYCSDIRITLSWRLLRRVGTGWIFSTNINFPCEGVSSPASHTRKRITTLSPEKRWHWESTQANLTNNIYLPLVSHILAFLQLFARRSCPFSLSCYFSLNILFFNDIKTSKLCHFFGSFLFFFMKAASPLYHVKFLTSNKCVCFFSCSSIFVSVIYRASEVGRGKIFPPLLISLLMFTLIV